MKTYLLLNCPEPCLLHALLLLQYGSTFVLIAAIVGGNPCRMSMRCEMQFFCSPPPRVYLQQHRSMTCGCFLSIVGPVGLRLSQLMLRGLNILCENHSSTSTPYSKITKETLGPVAARFDLSFHYHILSNQEFVYL